MSGGGNLRRWTGRSEFDDLIASAQRLPLSSFYDTVTIHNITSRSSNVLIGNESRSNDLYFA